MCLKGWNEIMKNISAIFAKMSDVKKDILKDASRQKLGARLW